VENRRYREMHHEAWFALGRETHQRVAAGELLLRISFVPDFDAPRLAVVDATPDPESRAGLLAEIRQGKKLKRIQDKTNLSLSRRRQGVFAWMSSRKVRVFGGTLADAVAMSAVRVPEIVFHCVEYLRREGRVAGIFRVPGNNDTMYKLRAILDKRDSVDFHDPHDAAGILKLYLRELNPPLIPFAFYDSFLELEEKKDVELELKIAKYQALEAQMPRENRETMAYITQFLKQLSELVADTKMDVGNLAIVFAPNIFRPQVESDKSLLQDTPKQIECMKSCIQHFNRIFHVFQEEEHPDWTLKRDL